MSWPSWEASVPWRAGLAAGLGTPRTEPPRSLLRSSGGFRRFEYRLAAPRGRSQTPVRPPIHSAATRVSTEARRVNHRLRLLEGPSSSKDPSGRGARRAEERPAPTNPTTASRPAPVTPAVGAPTAQVKSGRAASSGRKGDRHAPPVAVSTAPSTPSFSTRRAHRDLPSSRLGRARRRPPRAGPTGRIHVPCGYRSAPCDNAP